MEPIGRVYGFGFSRPIRAFQIRISWLGMLGTPSANIFNRQNTCALNPFLLVTLVSDYNILTITGYVGGTFDF